MASASCRLSSRPSASNPRGTDDRAARRSIGNADLFPSSPSTNAACARTRNDESLIRYPARGVRSTPFDVLASANNAEILTYGDESLTSPCTAGANWKSESRPTIIAATDRTPAFGSLSPSAISGSARPVSVPSASRTFARTCATSLEPSAIN